MQSLTHGCLGTDPACQGHDYPTALPRIPTPFEGFLQPV
jgi:hypothetical protein